MTVHLSEHQRIKILNSVDLFNIMREILAREEKIDQDKEHFWVIGLSNNNTLLFVELISLGSVNRVIVEPMEVFSAALQKRAVKIMLVHNHPSGEMRASEADKDTTDRLIQVGLVINTPVLDHLIITLDTYMSFEDAGLMEQLKKSKKWVPPYKEVERIKAEAMRIGRELGRKEGLIEGKAVGLIEGEAKGMKKGKVEGLKEGEAKGRKNEKIEIARSMLAAKKYTVEEIAEHTGLSVGEVEGLG